MINYRLTLILGYLLLILNNGAVYGDEKKRLYTEEEDIPGYVKKIFVPEEGLSDEEKLYLNVISKMADTLAATKDVNAIATQMSLDTKDIWGDMTNTYLNIDFHTSRGLGASKTTGLIIVQGPLKIEGLRPKPGVIHPPGTMVHQEFWFRVVGTNAGTGVGNYIHCAEVHPLDKTRSMICLFHDNGHLKMLFFTNEKIEQVGEQKTWSEDGEFLEKKVLKESRPLVIRK